MKHDKFVSKKTYCRKKSVSIYKVRSFSTIATHMLVYNKNYYKSTAAPHDKPGGFKQAGCV